MFFKYEYKFKFNDELRDKMSGDDYECPHKCMLVVPRVPLNCAGLSTQTPMMDY